MANHTLDQVGVLLVDDNQNMRALLQEVLRALRFRDVFHAKDGVEAFEIMRSAPIDLALIDIAMPIIDGYELIRMIRQAADSPNPLLPIIVVSGHAHRRGVLAARDAGAHAFVAKPVTAKNLITQILATIHDNRPFVRAPGFFGPDRRRRKDSNYAGPKRRKDDVALDLEDDDDFQLAKK